MTTIKDLLEAVRSLEERNNLAIVLELHGDGSSMVHEYWEDEGIRENPTIEELMKYLRTARYIKSEDGLSLSPVIHCKEPAEDGQEFVPRLDGFEHPLPSVADRRLYPKVYRWIFENGGELKITVDRTQVVDIAVKAKGADGLRAVARLINNFANHNLK